MCALIFFSFKSMIMESLPLLGVPCSYYTYDAAEDVSGVIGAATADQRLTRSKVEAHDFAIIVAFVTPYNSDRSAIASPIAKFQQTA